MSKLRRRLRHPVTRCFDPPKGTTVKYLIMVLSNPTSLAHWETLSDAEREEFGRAHYALTDALLDSGQLITSEGLAPAETATLVSVRDGAITATDGPLAEVKEHLAGFYLVECADLDDAIGIAARVPDAAFGHVEIRPVFDRSVLDG
jgi:hypothetical protein